MYWIFQAIPKRYDLRKRMVEGETETWLVTRYKDQIKRGDIVYFWLAGSSDIRGIYGWGRVTGDEVEYFSDWGHGIKVRYEKVFANHVTIEKLKSLPAMSSHILFHMAVGTNFSLNNDQVVEINETISELFGPGEVPHD